MNPRPNLPLDGRRWHVDWYGPVCRGRGGRTRIELILSPVAPDFALGLFPKPRAGFRVPSEQRTVPVSLDVFTRTPIGTLFKDGHQAGMVEYPHIHVEDVRISPETVRMVPTRVALAEQVDPYGLPLPCSASDDWCLAIECGRGEVIIPATEVLRFFYGTSAAVLGVLLSNDLERGLPLICDPARSHVVASHIEVCLRPAMAKGDAHLTAALVTSEVARARGRTIFPSLIASYRRCGSAHPKAYPPFVDTVALSLKGCWLGDPANQRFLAFEIVSSPLPIQASAIAFFHERRETSAGNRREPEPRRRFVRARPPARRQFANEPPMFEPKRRSNRRVPRKLTPEDWRELHLRVTF